MPHGLINGSIRASAYASFYYPSFSSSASRRARAVRRRRRLWICTSGGDERVATHFLFNAADMPILDVTIGLWSLVLLTAAALTGTVSCNQRVLGSLVLCFQVLRRIQRVLHENNGR